MKHIIVTIIIIVSGVASQPLQAANTGNEEESSTKLNLWIPGLLVKMVAEIAEDHVDHEDIAAIEIMRKFGSMTICVRQGEAYTGRTDNKMNRKLARVEKRDYEDVLSVNNEGAKVNLSIRENKKGTVKRLLVLVDEPGETYVFVKMHCRFSPEQLSGIVQEYSSI